MTRVRPFKGSLVNPARVREVVAPAYDSMSASERARFADARPDNFLNVMRTREDWPEDICVQEILRNNKRNLESMIANGSFCEQSEAGFVIYRLIAGGHQQTGLVAEIPVSEVDEGRVLKHELTRREHEDLLVDYQSFVGVSSSPVALAFHADTSIRRLMASIAESTTPYLDYEGDDGVRQQLWRVTDCEIISELRGNLSTVENAYLTDGHHRVAAASRYLANRRASGELSEGDWDHLLVALFPADELSILPFNRCVRDLNGMDESGFLGALSEHFHVSHLQCSADSPSSPETMGNFVMVLDDNCYQLTIKDTSRDPDDPVGGLDVTRLQNLVLGPLLGIEDARGDNRLEYLSGTTGVSGVNELRRKGWRLAFYCHPVSMAELMAVADAGQFMPPKSTCFEPKVRSGLFLLLKD